jgi:hypothetical protein
VADSDYAVVNSNDQRCYLRYPAGADIQAGDLFAFGISHSCAAFDKWDVLYRVAEAFDVIVLLDASRREDRPAGPSATRGCGRRGRARAGLSGRQPVPEEPRAVTKDRPGRVKIARLA